MSKILLVEDDAILLIMYRDKFVHEGFEVETAIDGDDGIKKLQSFRPDIVLLDLIMPRVSGFNVLKFAKNDPTLKKIPIVILTNIYADAEDLVKNWGAAYFLLKADYTPDQIVEKVNQLLAQDGSHLL